MSRTSPEGAFAPDIERDGYVARLLIVDDERALMRALCDSLALESYVTQGYVSAKEALAALKPGAFDLLITDLMMPEMDGMALSRAARAIDPGLVAIVMTGHGTIDTAVRAMQEGALDVQRLRRENARLQESERAKSQALALAFKDLESFSYSVSHDLRAPLRAVASFAEILDEDYSAALDAEGRRIVGVIRNGARSMDRLIVGLLEFSRTASGQNALDLAPVDMSALAHAAAREARLLYQGPEPEIAVGELPSAMGDATLLRQVWINLLSNALKYSSKRAQPRVAVSGRIEGDELVFQVEDNGAGFDMRYAEKLFGVFQRLHPDSEFSGTGVGLAIVERIVAGHGGRVWAEGTPDVGACFHFALPAAAPLGGLDRSIGNPPADAGASS